MRKLKIRPLDKKHFPRIGEKDAITSTINYPNYHKAKRGKFL